MRMLAQEGLAVFGVADGARRDREHALRAKRLELAPVVRQSVTNARDRQRNATNYARNASAGTLAGKNLRRIRAKKLGAIIGG